MLHHRLDFLGAALALLYDRDTFFFRETIFDVNLLEQLEYRDALVFCPSCDFSQDSAGRNGVFVANEVFAQEAVAFLAAADVALLALVFAHDVGNPFEARVHVVDFHTVLFGDGAERFRRNDCLHDVFLAVQLAQLFPAGNQVVSEEERILVAVEEHPFALVVLHGAAHAVAVGVRSHYEVGIHFLGFFYSHREGSRFLGIRGNYRREVAADDVLLRYVDNVREAESSQCARNNHDARPVNRGIDNLHVVVASDSLRREGNLRQVCYILLVDFFADGFNESRVAFELDVGGAAYFVYFGDCVLVVRGNHLCAVAPVSLVSVVFLRVVRSRQDDTALASQFADSVRHFGSRAEAFEDINFDAVSREDIGRDFGKLAAVVAAIVPDDYLDFVKAIKFFLQVIRQALGGSTYGIDVHAV